jgi:trigger factor
MARQALRELLAREALWPATAPTLDRIEGDRFVAAFEAFPHLPALDVSALAVARPVARVTAEDVEEMVGRLRLQRRAWHRVQRPAREGDRVVLELAAEGSAGRLPPRGTRREELVLGRAGPWQGLAPVLLGRSRGESAECVLTAEESAGPLARVGLPSTVSLRLVEVQEEVLPPLDAPFIRGFGVAEGTVEALRERLARTMEEELAEAVTAEVERRVEEALVAAFPHVEVSDALLQAEVERLRRVEVESEADRGPDRPGGPGERLPAPMSAAPSSAALLDRARASLAAACLFFEIARQNGLSPTPAAILARIEERARAYEDSEEAVDRFLAEGDLYREVEEEVLRRQVVAWVLERAQVSEEPATFADFVRRDDPPPV